jgi:hypothetical protein
LNHTSYANPNNSINDFTDEMTIFEILKLIENPEEQINNELPFILENLINSKKLDETNTNAILIADLSRVIIQHLKWIKCFPNIKPFYKIEANNNCELLKVMKKLGINFVCTRESHISDFINIESISESQNNNYNLNNYETGVKLNNSFSINNLGAKNNSSKNNFNASYSKTENCSIESNSTKIIFSAKTNVNANDLIYKENEILTDLCEIHHKKIDSFICNNIEEIKEIIEKIPSAKILLRVLVNEQSEITRAEKNRLNEIFENLEELEFTNNIKGLSLELIVVNKNEIGNYLKPNRIYEIIKRAREIIDQAEEFGIEMKIFDIGSPENETFLNEDNIKLLNESLDYFFSDLKIEFISQLGKFFCAPAFFLMQRNRKALNANTNENLNNSSDNNINSNSNSSFNLVGLNSTEISLNGNISAINQNSTYYLDLDFLPLEENNNLCLNNSEESANQLINKNFPDDFILNNSSIFDSPTSNSKENNINLNSDIIVDENLNKFICLSIDKNFHDEFDLKKIKLEEPVINDIQNCIENCKKLTPLKEIKFKTGKNQKNSNYVFQKTNGKAKNFENDLKEEFKKIECQTKNCIKWKMDSYTNDSNKNILEDWFIFENVGNDDICKICKTKGYCKPEIYYINNRISIKLEKYFYVIMNKFDS